MSDDWTYRYDTIPLKHYELDSEGYLRFIAPISKVGTLRYWDADKKEFYDEFVPEKTLVDSLDSFKTKPITLLHPSEKVTPSNSRNYSRGLTGYSGFFDGSFLWLTGTATDKELIDKATRGDCQELSCGYDALIALSDSIRFQARRKGNHLAFVPKGRAGREVRLKLDDSSDLTVPYVEYHCDDDLTLVKVPDQLYDHLRDGKVIVPISNPKKVKETSSMVQILLKDQVFSVDGEDAASLKTAITGLVNEAKEWKEKADQTESLAAKVAALTDQVNTLTSDKARVDGELTATKVKLDEAVQQTETKQDDASIQDAIKTRLSIWSEVLPFIRKTDAAFSPDYALTEHQVRKEYLLKRVPDQKTYLDSLDLNTEAGQKAIEGMYIALRPSNDSTAQEKTHADGVLDLITQTTNTTKESKKDSVDPRLALQKKLEGAKA